MSKFFQTLFGLPILFVKILKKLIMIIPKIMTAYVTFVIVFITKIVPIVISLILNAGVILETFIYYLSNPTKLFQLFVSFLLFIPVMFISILYHIPFENGYKLGDFFMYFLISPLYSSIMIIITILYWFVIKFVIEYSILGSLDKILHGSLSSFYYRYLIACENPPDAWYMTPSFQHGNKNESRIFAYKTCSKGYKPNGVFCEKMKYFEPSYCTVAHIYRKFSEEKDNEFSSSGLYYPDEFKYTQSFLRKSEYKQLQDIEEYKEDVRNHQIKCDLVHKSKDTLVKSICKGMVDESDSDIRGLCQKQYCSHTNEAFCHQLIDSKIQNNERINDSNLFVIVKVLMFILIAIISGIHFKKNR